MINGIPNRPLYFYQKDIIWIEVANICWPRVDDQRGFFQGDVSLITKSDVHRNVSLVIFLFFLNPQKKLDFLKWVDVHPNFDYSSMYLPCTCKDNVWAAPAARTVTGCFVATQGEENISKLKS